MAKFLLIDGNAILHRAYHALPPLTNKKGEAVNAVYGFFSMLLNVLADQKPDYLAVCFDRAAPNFRQTLFAGYQQHRPKAADDFVPQIILVHELLERMRVAVFELDGYEADDLIGTIARESQISNLKTQNFNSKLKNTKNLKESEDKKNIEVVILTGDRDMLQLVNGNVKILMPLVGITKTVLMGSEEVEKKYGVRPDQFVDYKALIGDASDGYPGVAGIGPKTASSLLQKYGTFENLYEHVGELPEKVGLKLATDAEQAALAKKLARIVTDAPIQFEIEKCEVGKFVIADLMGAFEEQGFKSLMARYDKVFGSVQMQDEKKNEGENKSGSGQMGLF